MSAVADALIAICAGSLVTLILAGAAPQLGTAIERTSVVGLTVIILALVMWRFQLWKVHRLNLFSVAAGVFLTAGSILLLDAVSYLVAIVKYIPNVERYALLINVVELVTGDAMVAATIVALGSIALYRRPATRLNYRSLIEALLLAAVGSLGAVLALDVLPDLLALPPLTIRVSPAVALLLGAIVAALVALWLLRLVTSRTSLPSSENEAAANR